MPVNHTAKMPIYFRNGFVWVAGNLSRYLNVSLQVSYRWVSFRDLCPYGDPHMWWLPKTKQMPLKMAVELEFPSDGCGAVGL